MSLQFPKEAAAIAARRDTYKIDPNSPRVAIAFAGGGIRSATFSLGILRALSSLKLLHKVDYLSTVSGGGYVGAFYCGLFARRDGLDPIVDANGSTDFLSQEKSQKALHYLRQSGRYLTPAGSRDYIYAVALLTRNWFALMLMCGTAICLAALLLDGIRAVLLGICPAYQQLLWLSPLAAILPILILAGIATGWAYWLTMQDVTRPWFCPPIWGTALIFVVSYGTTYGLSVPYLPRSLASWLGVSLAACALLAITAWAVASILERRGAPTSKNHERAIIQDRIRHRLTNWHATVAAIGITILFIAVIDSGTFALARALAHSGSIAALWGPVAGGGAVPAARGLVKRLAALRPSSSGAMGGATKPSFLARSGTVLAWAAAALLGFLAVAIWSGAAHWLSWHDLFASSTGHPTPITSGASPSSAAKLSASFGAAVLAAGLFVLLASVTHGFVNLSSLATFYAGRLRRAYLGAGNPMRIGVGEDTDASPIRPVRESDRNDDLGLVDYYDRSADGAPVHLINVTINETRGKGPTTVQRDRHGLNMVISPDGFSYSESSQSAVITKPLGDEDRQPVAPPPSTAAIPVQNPGQSLALSSWIGISGAAFTTGLGSRTNLAYSILAFLSNVRLGYWWKADRDRIYTPPSYWNLWRELAADFPGTDAAQWYLSDGGHFENTAVYELIRRKIPFIIASDNGCDPHYGFEDIANLVRKCRIDFGAEIQFLDAEDLDACSLDQDLRQLFASPAQFQDSSAVPNAIAMLAEITFAPDGGEAVGSSGTLLVIKPRLTQDGPADLIRYFADNPQFPQQTTLDQFFDEAQWESYYELGRLITKKLFERHETESWQLNSLNQIQVHRDRGAKSVTKGQSR